MISLRSEDCRTIEISLKNGFLGVGVIGTHRHHRGVPPASCFKTAYEGIGNGAKRRFNVVFVTNNTPDGRAMILRRNIWHCWYQHGVIFPFFMSRQSTHDRLTHFEKLSTTS